MIGIRKIRQRSASKTEGTVREKKTVKGKKIAPKELDELISKKAYKLYEKRGYTHGNDQRDWYEAEKAVYEGAGKK